MFRTLVVIPVNFNRSFEITSLIIPFAEFFFKPVCLKMCISFYGKGKPMVNLTYDPPYIGLATSVGRMSQKNSFPLVGHCYSKDASLQPKLEIKSNS